jgi:predicted TIM-barrel fold metal-dependent hydrolase
MPDSETIRAIDCWVNPFTPEQAGSPQPDFLVRVATDYFHREKEVARGTPLDEMVRMMDAAGIDRGILTINAADPRPFAAMAARYPERFLLSAVIDPLQGMQAVCTVERLVELGVAVSVNTGIPGPPMPAEPQRPLHLDEVCLFYPDLVLIMAHGADPWWGEAIRLMLKYPNLYMMTSAYAPKYLPPELIQFMNTRGQGKILFASDHPVLSFERCLAEAEALPLREGVLEKYLRTNALAVFDWS